jgi:ankyrin repeat protein
MTALMSAVIANHSEICHALIEAGADVNKQEEVNFTDGNDDCRPP